MNGSLRLWIRDAHVGADDTIVALAGWRHPVPVPPSDAWSDADWDQPYDDGLYALDGVDWGTSWTRVLRYERGTWRKEILPCECYAIRGSLLVARDGVVRREAGGYQHTRFAHPRGIPLIDLAARGDELFGVTGFVARDQVCVVEARTLACTPFGTSVRARVRCIAVTSDRRLVVAGEGIHVSSPSGWTCVREHRGDLVCCLALGPRDEILAGTVRGAVVAGDALLDAVPGAAPITSVVRFRGELFASTDDGVFRHAAKGFARVAVPAPSHRVGPTCGKLAVARDRLWVAGTHALCSSGDGERWEPFPFLRAR